jgi:isoquinoline 1-oxidoreductase alpha subunit
MAATALLAATPKPSAEEIRDAMTNICRCGTYNAVARAITLAGEQL